MKTQEIREMEKRAEMYRRLLIWNIVFLLGLLCWGSVQGQNGEYQISNGLPVNLANYRESFENRFINDSLICIRYNKKSTIYNANRQLSIVVDSIDLLSYTVYSKSGLFYTSGTEAISMHRYRINIECRDHSNVKRWTYSYVSHPNPRSYGNTKIFENFDSTIFVNGSEYSDTLLNKFPRHFIIKLDRNGNFIWKKYYETRKDSLEASHEIKQLGNKLLLTNTVYRVDTINSSNWPIPIALRATVIDTNGNILRRRIISYKFSFRVHISNNNSICYIVNADGGSVSFIRLDSMLVEKYSGNKSHLNNWENISPGDRLLFDEFSENLILYSRFNNISKLIKLSDSGDIIWEQRLPNLDGFTPLLLSDGLVRFHKNNFYIFWYNNGPNQLLVFSSPKHSIKGSVFPDFNSNCLFNKPSEYNIPKILIHNKIENTYAVTTDSMYTMYLFDRDTADLKIINLDSNLFVSCGKDSIVVDMTGKKDTSGVDFPIRSNKTGHCINITSFSSGLLRPGRWGDYQLYYQNNAFDTAYNAYIEIELDTAAIDSIKSPYSFTLTGTILRFNLGHVRPFGFSSVTYSIKLKTTVIIGSSHCHRAKVYPICNLYPSAVYDSSEIQPMMRCLPNDTVEFTLKNIGLRDQKDWGHSIIYVDELILKTDSFKLTVGNSRVFKYKLDTNKVFTAEVFNSNFHPVTPILIRHNDLCANKRPMIPSNPALNFSRHDEAKEYEEACTIVRGSYDPNMKSVLPVGMFSQHYTATGTELKYRLDFQNTGTDTAFRVVLVDTLSADLDMASFVPGASSHSYRVEFGGRAVKFIFDPIALVDSFKNEPLSHGYVCFKIKHKKGIAPKTKIENFVDIYFDYNAPVRTNTVFNTIFDTIQIYVPKAADTTKGKDSTSSIQGVNQTSIIVFPNPTTDKFFIQMSEPVKNLAIEIYDMQGRLTKSLSSTNSQTLEVTAEGMIKGIYHIRVLSGEKLVVVKKIQVE
jgi:uncharacterized repeat protein (TIGR01451 family)